MLSILFSLLLSLNVAVAERVERISKIHFKRNTVGKIYLYPGRSSLIDFPCHITKVSTGPSQDVVVKVAESTNSELDLWLNKGTSQPTNLTVRCSEKVFVFDVIPSKVNHQDYVKIISSFENSINIKKLKKLYSSEPEEKSQGQVKIPRGKLIYSSTGEKKK